MFAALSGSLQLLADDSTNDVLYGLVLVLHVRTEGIV